MNNAVESAQHMLRMFEQVGARIVISLLITVGGVMLTKYIVRKLPGLLGRFISRQEIITTICRIFYMVAIIFIIGRVLVYWGVDHNVVGQMADAAILITIGLWVLFKPYIPVLPFQVGHVIKTGDLLGRVETLSMLNTRLKTFDGKTIFVPNSKIMNDYLINYHFTPSRRVSISVGIGYDQDLLKAKELFESILIEDPRVKKTPRPNVKTVDLDDYCIRLTGHAWVANTSYWAARCDLIEKVKLGLDANGIVIAFPRQDIRIVSEDPPLPETPINY